MSGGCQWARREGTDHSPAQTGKRCSGILFPLHFPWQSGWLQLCRGAPAPLGRDGTRMAAGWLSLTRVHPHQSPVLLGTKGLCDHSVTAENLAHSVGQLWVLCPDLLWLDVGSSLWCLSPQDNLENYEKWALRRHLAHCCHRRGPLGPSPQSWERRGQGGTGKGGVFPRSLQEPHARAPSRLRGAVADTVKTF